jgi:integrase/recombinase XerD
MSALAPTLQAFFTERLICQRSASPHTIAAYRDTMRLLLRFAAEHHRKPPSDLDVDDLHAPLIGAFLDYLEHERGNSARTRNARLAAIRSLFRYAALKHPEHAATIQRVLSIPPKRFDRALISFLTETELDALLSAPDRTTWTGRRDHALILLATQTGLRISELTGLTRTDVQLGHGAHVSCLGKGRKHRITPLTTTTIAVLRTWLRERRGEEADPLFPTRTGTTLSRDALEHRLTKHAAAAAERCPSLHDKRITAHVHRHLRHRALARPRASRHNPDLPPRRPRPQRTGTRQNQAARHQTRPLPAIRHAPRLPRSALIMPTPARRSPPPQHDPDPTSA